MAVRKHLGKPAEVVVVQVGLNCQKPLPRPVQVGERFRSIAWAECSTGISRTKIVGQLSGRLPHARGVVFAYAEDAA